MVGSLYNNLLSTQKFVENNVEKAALDHLLAIVLRFAAFRSKFYENASAYKYFLTVGTFYI